MTVTEPSADGPVDWFAVDGIERSLSAAAVPDAPAADAVAEARMLDASSGEIVEVLMVVEAVSVLLPLSDEPESDPEFINNAPYAYERKRRRPRKFSTRSKRKRSKENSSEEERYGGECMDHHRAR